MMNTKYEKQDVKGWMLLIDVVVTLVMIASAVMLVYNAYLAGAKLGAGVAGAEQRMHYWTMMTSVAFLVGSLAYLFGRYFKDRLAEVHNPWM